MSFYSGKNKDNSADINAITTQVASNTSSLAEKAKQTDLETQSSRIDNIVANAGDVSNNAELIDQRIDVTGTRHATAGNALRFGQSTQLFDYDVSPMAVGYKKFLQFTYENGGFNFSTGATATDASCIRTSAFVTVPTTLRILNTGYRYRIYKYNKADNSFNSYLGWYTDADKTIALDPVNFTYKITIATQDASAINFEDVIKKVKFLSSADKLLLDKSLIPDLISNVKFLTPSDGRLIDFDFTAKTITIPADTCIIWRNKYYSIKNGDGSDVVTSFSSASGTTVVGYFNTLDKTFLFTSLNSTMDTLGAEYVLFCAFRIGYSVSINSKYNVKGVRPDKNEIVQIISDSIKDPSTLPSYGLLSSFISSPDGRPIDFDFTNQTITFPYDTCLVWKDKFYSIKGANSTDTVVSFSAAAGTTVRGYFNVKTNTFVFTPVSTTFTGIEDCVLFCTFRKSKWVSIRGKYTVKGVRPDYDEIQSIVANLGGVNSKKSIVKSVGHQGYHLNAPNNSIPAYIESYKNGFDVADCDVQWTSDGVGVLCHDNDISTWSNGTGNITDMTYNQLLTYDFGSWKSPTYAGLKIATFKDYVKTAKLYGLELYIEPKAGNTTANVTAMLDYIKVMGMLDKTTITCASIGVLNQCKAYSDKIRLGLITYDYQASYIDTVKTLQTNTNYAFLFPTYTAITEQILQDVINAGVGIELWTIDDPALIKTYAPYCSGICSNNYTVLGASNL
jgi:glycerophosphoryl diester phosphodiesterase